jgi:hypothetical protein
MQTFLPFNSFTRSAAVLDRKRLGKQRVECKQIFRAMYDGGAWANHPAVRMWRGHGWWLLFYYDAICIEWRRRGYKHEMMIDPPHAERAFQEKVKPPWLGVPIFHLMHRVRLLEKDPVYYQEFKKDMDYVQVYMPRFMWPVGKDGKLVDDYAHRVEVATLPFTDDNLQLAQLHPR